MNFGLTLFDKERAYTLALEHAIRSTSDRVENLRYISSAPTRSVSCGSTDLSAWGSHAAIPFISEKPNVGEFCIFLPAGQDDPIGTIVYVVEP